MLELKKVCKTFNPGTSNEVQALCGVDLAIDEGSWVIVIGTNGSGKSTLLQAVAGSFPVYGGTIHLADRDVRLWADHGRTKMIGGVFQTPLSGTAPTMSIAENFALATRR